MKTINSHPWSAANDKFYSDDDQIITTGRVDLLNGSDSIYINGSLTIKKSGSLVSGEGNDSIIAVTLRGLTGILLEGKLEMGGGADKIKAEGLWDTGVLIGGELDLGEGDNSLLASSPSKGLMVWGGSITSLSGNDRIDAALLAEKTSINQAADLISSKISLGEGDDVFAAVKGAISLSNSTIDMGAGNDTLTTDSILSLYSNSSLYTGSGSDVVEGSADLDARSRIDLGDGKDTYRGYASTSTFSNTRGFIDGGEGDFDEVILPSNATYTISLDEGWTVILREHPVKGSQYRQMNTIRLEYIGGSSGIKQKLVPGKYSVSAEGIGAYDFVLVPKNDNSQTEQKPMPANTTSSISAPVNRGTAAFSITGTPAVGQILTTAATSRDPDGDGTFSYQWQSSSDGGLAWTAIAAANASTYTVAAADAGKTIQALITYKDLKGFQESVTATPVVIPFINNGAARFSITGTPAVGQILTTAATSRDPDGDGTFSYQWQSSSDGGLTWTAIAAANASTYTIAAAENSKRLRSVISYKDQEGFSEVVTTEPISINSGVINSPSASGNNSPATSVSNGSGTTIINNTTINNITNNINSNNTTTNNINNSISITGSFNGNTSAQALAGSLKLEDPATKTALPINGDSAIKTLAQLTASKPLSDAARQLLDRYIIKDPSSSSSRKASASDAGFIDFTLKTGSLKSLTAEIALASEVKATAYVKINPNTGEAYDFTFDPVTGLGAELLDTNKNGLVDSLRIHLQDGAKGDVDGLINGEIRDPGVLADAPRQSVYRFFKASKGVHLYTSSEAERANVNANPGWGYKDEGVAYEALVTQGKALRRFFNAKASYHFMTTNEEEAKNINAHPEWGFKDEGTSFSVSTVPQFGMSTPVHRFYRVLDGVGQHFYTASADEANNILANPQWGYKSEGVGWYV